MLALLELEANYPTKHPAVQALNNLINIFLINPKTLYIMLSR